MRRALWLLLAVVAMLVGSAPAIAAPIRGAGRVDLGAENRVKEISTSGVVEAEGHTLFLQRDPNGYQDSVNQYAYGANDPINHRDPTGAYLDILAVGLLYGPKAAAGYTARIGQHLVSTALDSAAALCGPLCAVFGNPLRAETDLDADRAAGQAGFLEAINPANQAARSAVAAGNATGFEKGVQLADTAKGLLDSALLALGGARSLGGGLRYAASANDRAVAAASRAFELPSFERPSVDAVVRGAGGNTGLGAPWETHAQTKVQIKDLGLRHGETEIFPERVDHYREILRQFRTTDALDPVMVAEFNGQRVLLDGHHRVHAASGEGYAEVDAQVVKVSAEKFLRLLAEVQEAAQGGAR